MAQELEAQADELLDKYTALVPQLQATPYSRPLHLEHVEITKGLGLVEELDAARNLLNSYFPLSQAEWIDWINDKKAALSEAQPDDIDPHINLIELYKRAAQDCPTIPLLISYSEYYSANYYAAEGLSPPAEAADGDEDEQMDEAERRVGEPNPILGTAFGLEDVRSVRDEVLVAGGANLAESQGLWKVWEGFELDLLKLNKTLEQVKALDAFYLARLRVPHIGIEDTFAAYSSFVTRENNDNYSTLLPAANKLYAPSLKAMTEREAEELKLKQAGNADWAYAAYINWELEVKNPDIPLVLALFNRAVADHPSNVVLWEMYLDFCSTLPKARMPVMLEVAERAVKHNPGSGSLWAIYFRAAEKNQQGAEAVEALFQRAIGTGLMQKEVEELVVLYEARAGFHRREVDALITDPEAIEPEMIDPVVEILEEGLMAVQKAAKKGGGDPMLRLEKHLLRMYERFGRLEEASELWSKLVKARPTNYATWYGYADFETRYGSVENAQQIYKDGCGQKGLDYPEYLLEAWLVFARQNATLADLEYTLARVKRQKRGLEAKRQREAAAAGVAVASTSSVPAAQVEAVDNSKKRERSPVDEGSSKKAKVEAAPPPPAALDEPKRDRENSTVIVITSSEAQVTEEDLKALFKDCGEIRESKLKTIGHQNIAMIEFMDRDTVLAAQTKDKKKINDFEVEVHIAWKSCLWVTNYPESYDKAAVEELFAKYGTIFDTRWPSKRFKTNRRFCYVQFTSTASAEASLELHNRELEPGLKLQVAISDPSAKKGRTDAGANQKELYVAGLSKFVKEFDLKKLFEPFGAIKGIRLGLDDKGECKGFAFVEYEDEAAAQASLSLNNHELKKRHMSVTIAQARVTGIQKTHAPERRADTEGRSVRVRGIKPGTEEAIVQQAFAKLASVRVVVMVAGSSEAVVELESVAEAGKVLMAKDSITIDDVPVEVSAYGRQVRNADGKKPAGTEGEKLMPRQASRGRGRVGLAGARGSRGRPGLGARGTPGPGAAATPAAPGGGRSQDDFRALLAKKA